MPSHYESFGMVALEAMACGTPVVASQVGGLAFLVQDGVNGFHVPVDNPGALSDRLVTILDDHSLRAEMSKKAAEISRDYAWPKITARVFDVYREVLGEKDASKEVRTIM